MADSLIKKRIRKATVEELTVVSLNSDGPLSDLLDSTLPSIDLRSDPKLSALTAGSVEDADGAKFDVHAIETADGKIWIQGDSVLFGCPDCQAPMSVRLWLMIADCWQCGTSVHLTEEQQRQVQQALESRRETAAKRQPSTAPPPPPEPSSATPAATAALARVDNARVERAPARTGRPTPSRTAPAVEGRRQPPRPVQRFQLGPAWLVSLILHLLIILLLALITFTPKEDWESITLSTFVSPEDTTGGDVREIELNQPIQDDLPLPPEQDLSETEIRERLAKADQDARELQIDPTPTVPLPDLDAVKNRIAGPPGARPIFAARDPRLRADVVKKEGGTLLTEAAVSRGLRWLAEHQNQDGSWSLSDYNRSHRAGNRGDAAATALALLPFLGAGQTHEYGVYKENVSKGLRWLIQNQKSNGDLRAEVTEAHGMYAHGQATIVLVEALAMTGDERFRGPAQRAVDFIVEAQHDEGGWRYRPGEEGDTSVLGWQLMALQSARAPGTGLRVPDTTLKLASYYLDLASEEEGSRYCYLPEHRNPPTASMTAEALLCRVYLGWTRDDPRLRAGQDWLRKKHPPARTEGNLYYWYYGTQLFHHIGGPAWDEWNVEMRDLLVNSQDKRGRNAGSWSPDKYEYGSAGGRIYTTALAVCILEVYYRHLPLFKQIDLE